jgi:hypothetical protein
VNKALDDYFFALRQLQRRGAKISNDSVALEAGRKKGSIKKSRPQFRGLIDAIEAAAVASADGCRNPMDEIASLKREKKELQTLLDESRAREVGLIYQVFRLQRQMQQVTVGKVVPLRGRKK